MDILFVFLLLLPVLANKHNGCPELELKLGKNILFEQCRCSSLAVILN